MSKKITLIFALLSFATFSFAQLHLPGVKNYQPSRLGANGANELPKRVEVLDIASQKLDEDWVKQPNTTLRFSLFDKKEACEFQLFATKALHPSLAAKYNIRTYSGQNPKNPSELLSLSVSPIGVYGTIQMKNGNFYIEPDRNDATKAMVFAAADDPRKAKNAHTCSVGEHSPLEHIENSMPQARLASPKSVLGVGDAFRPTGDILKIYRFACAVGAESTATLAGGSASPKTVVLALLANLLNASNNVLRRDVALQLELVADNDLVIFTLPSTLPLPLPPYNPTTIPTGMQPFPSPPYNPTTILLDYCKNTLDAYLDYTTFDAGFIINDGIGGGWANIDALHSTSDKCRGIGNPDYEIFIHEFGHMGGSNHNITDEDNLRTTFGGTIMGNRGNTRSASGDQYSSHTIDNFTRGCYGTTSNASQSNPSGNAIPQIVTMPPAGVVIPKLTPFKLKGVAADADAAQTLTYTWEQNDPSTVNFSVPNFPPATGPLFSSVFPTTDGATRYFPDLSFLTTNTTSSLETMPFATRNLNFRFIVRDNYAPCGGLNFKNVAFSVDGNSGPFEVSCLNTTGNVLTGNANYTVTWNRNGTQNAPVNCSQVKISLSHDGGLTYPTVLGTFPNNGSASVLFPNNIGTTKRIMIEGVGNVFFDINNQNFEIFDGTIAGLNVQASQTEKVIHTQTATTLTLDIQALGTYTGTVSLALTGLPTGATATFPNGQPTIILTPNNPTTLIFANLNSVAQGSYPITITTTGNSGIVKTTIFTLIKTGVAAITPGNAISFSGSNTATASNMNVPSQEVTFSAWIKRNNAVNADLEGLVSFPSAPGAGSKPMLYVNNDGNLKYHEKWWEASDHFIIDGEWTFVAVVVRAGEATLYKNGVPSVITIDNGSILPFSGTMIMGGQSTSSRRFQGLIDEAKIWSRALTTDEIREQMHLTMPASEVDNGLFAYYQFNQAGGAINDVIRSKNLTLQSNPTYVGSGAAVGKGVVQTKTVNTAGVTNFSTPTNTGLSINFGASPNGNVVVTKLNGIVPNGTVASTLPTTPDYWIVNNFGTNTNLNATMTFTTASGFIQNPNTAFYQLYKRPSVSVGAWAAPITSSAVNVAAGQVSFTGINSFSQFLISNSSPVSVQTVTNQSSVKVFPNPFSTLVTITGGTKATTVEIFDLLGRKCFEQKIDNIEVNTLDLTALPKNASYLLNIDGSVFKIRN